MLDKKYAQCAKEQALYYAGRLPKPTEYPKDISSRGKSAIIAYLLVDTEALKQYDEEGLDYWHCEISTALRRFGIRQDLMPFGDSIGITDRNFIRLVMKELRVDVGLNRIHRAPVRLNHQQDTDTIIQMLIQIQEDCDERC